VYVHASAAPGTRRCSSRVVADGLRHHAAPDEVAPGDLDRLARDRHQRVHHVGPSLAPHPGLHAAHRRSDHRAQVIDAEALRDQQVLGKDHVVVAVAGKLRVHAVARLRRPAATEAVGQDEVVLRGVEDLPGPEELSRERRVEEVLAGACRTVEQQDRVRHMAGAVALRSPERGVVQADLREYIAGLELEIACDEIGFLLVGIALRRERAGSKRRYRHNAEHRESSSNAHRSLLLGSRVPYHVATGFQRRAPRSGLRRRAPTRAPAPA